jgi:hypothetical protein
MILPDESRNGAAAADRPRLLYVSTLDHIVGVMLPHLDAARECGFAVEVACRVTRLRDELLEHADAVHDLPFRRFPLHPGEPRGTRAARPAAPRSALPDRPCPQPDRRLRGPPGGDDRARARSCLHGARLPLPSRAAGASPTRRTAPWSGSRAISFPTASSSSTGWTTTWR